MFICGECNKVSQVREKQYKKIVETRGKQYLHEQYGTFHVGKKQLIVDDHGKPVYKITTGYEIIKEISVCGNCQ